MPPMRQRPCRPVPTGTGGRGRPRVIGRAATIRPTSGERMNDTRSSHETLWDLIKDTRFCMLSHRHEDGTLHSHPLTTQNKALDEGASLYFFVSNKTELGKRLQADGNVNLAYANPEKDTWVSI